MIIETSLDEVHIVPIIVIKIILTHGHLIDTKMARWGKNLGFTALQRNSAICHSAILVLHTCLGFGFGFFFLQAHGSCVSCYNSCILVMCAMECLLERHFQEPPLLLFQSRKSWGTCYQQKKKLFIVTIVKV